jgi:tetratricopeptide (TPR) repeat protein
LIASAAILTAGCGDGRTRNAANDTTQVSRSAIEASLKAAEEYFQVDDLPRAEAILLRLIERAPAEAHAYEMHAQVLLARSVRARAQGDHDASAALAEQAYERYLKVIEHSTPSSGLHHSAGDVAQLAGKNDEALAQYREAMRLDPAQSRHAIFAAQLLGQAQKLDEAEAILRQALVLDDDEPLIHASLANIALQREQFDEALEHIREARAIRPGDVSFRVIEAMIHRRGGRPGRAVELLIGLSTPQRAQRSVASEMAASYSMLGEHSAAAEAWMRCFRARPDDAQAWHAAIGAAEELLKAGNRHDANLWVEQAKVSAALRGAADPNAAETIAAVERKVRDGG